MVGGVGHDTDVEVGSVRRTARLGPEGKLEGVDGQHGGVNLRQNDIVGIGVFIHVAGGVGVVPVEAAVAAIVGVGGATSDVGIDVAAAGEAGPAMDEVRVASTGGGIAFEILEEGKRVDDKALAPE